VAKVADLAGAAHLMLVDGVSYLDPAPAVFEAMLEGWTKQQRASFLKWDGTIKPRLSLVRRFAEFSNQYPWQWQSAEFEAFMDHLRAKTPTFSVSSGRNYQNHLRMFCEYITDPRYGWMSVCQQRFGEVPAVDGRPRGPLRHPGLPAQRPHRDPGRQRTGTQNRQRRDARPASGRAPDLDSAARRLVTASSPTAPSTVARLAAQAARMEAATATAISQLTSALPSLDPQQAAAALVVAVPIPVRGAARFLEELAGHLAAHRDALTLGSSLCPPVLLRLAEVLHDAGQPVVRPGCAHCGKVRSDLRQLRPPKGGSAPAATPGAGTPHALAAGARAYASQPAALRAASATPATTRTELLARLVTEGHTLTHELLDALPSSRNQRYIRQLLVHTGILDERHEDLERIPGWLEHELTDKPPAHANLARPFLHWFLLRRARQRAAIRRHPASADRDLRRRVASPWTSWPGWTNAN
jgi:hypothetical protein